MSVVAVAEDGIRDLTVTGVQTCALPIWYERDVSRMVFNDNIEVLDDLKRRAGLESDSLAKLLASVPEPTPHKPYIVVSIEEHRLWYRQGEIGRASCRERV